MKLTRHRANPILKPSKLWWENKAVFNPGAAMHRGKIVLLYRSIGDDNISRLGYAHSDDGIRFRRFDQPIYDPPVDDPLERIGAEDARITFIDNQYVILYTAASLYPAVAHSKTSSISTSKTAPFRIRIGMATTKDFQTIAHHGHLFAGLDTKDAALFPEKINGKYHLLHRVFPNLSLATSPDYHQWEQHYIIAKPRKHSWDSHKIGAGSPPIKTKHGWLLFYHGIDTNKRYHLGIMVLAQDNPGTVLYRSPQPILSPEKPYEKTGTVSHVVFTCGAVAWKNHYYVYYGAADTVIGLATIPIREVDEVLQREIKQT